MLKVKAKPIGEVLAFHRSNKRGTFSFKEGLIMSFKDSSTDVSDNSTGSV